MIGSIIRRVLGAKREKIAQKDFYVKDGQSYFYGQVYPRGSHFDVGIPAYRLDDLMQVKEVDELVKRVHQGLPMSDEQFNTLVLPVIRNFAAHAHYLPASERHHHRAPLGLLRHSLQVAIYSMNIARSKYFKTGVTPREIRDNEVRWHVAAVLAGLLHDAGKPFTDYEVTDDKGRRWTHSEPLSKWLENNDATLYTLKWLPDRAKLHESATCDAASLILTPEIRQYLTLHTRAIWQDLYSMLEGRLSESALYPMMLEADKLSTSKDVESEQVIASDGDKSPTYLYFFQAAKSLMDQGKWKVNELGGRVFEIKNHGTFIDLDQGGSSLSAEIRKLGHAGVPQDIKSITRILVDYRLLVPFDGQGEAGNYNWVFQIDFQTDQGVITQEVNLVKLSSGQHIFGELRPEPITGTLISVKSESEAPNQVEPDDEQQTLGVTQESNEQDPSEDGEEGQASARPRDFDQMMSQLAEQEGKFQPALQEQQAENEKTEAEATKPDPVADIAKSLTQTLRGTQAKQEEEAEITVVGNDGLLGNAEKENTENANKETISTPKTVVSIDDLSPATSSKRKSQGEQVPAIKQKLSPASLKPTSQGVFASLSSIANKPSGQNTSAASLKPPRSENNQRTEVKKSSVANQKQATKVNKQETAVLTSPVTEDPPVTAKTKPKRKKKKRKLTIREELERDSREIEREQRQAKRLKSPTELTPAAINHQVEVVADQELPKSSGTNLLAPPAALGAVQEEQTDKPREKKRLGLGPSTGNFLITENKELAKPVPKLLPEKRNRPKINIANEKKAVAKQQFENLPLVDQLSVHVADVSREAVEQLASEVQRVLSREVPLGVTLSLNDGQVVFEPGTFSEDIQRQLCGNASCDTESNGALIITDGAKDVIATAINHVQGREEASTNGDQVTENVTLLDPATEQPSTKSIYVTASQAVDILIEQMKVGHGSLIDSSYSVQGSQAFVGSAATMILIRNQWPHISRSDVRREMARPGCGAAGSQFFAEIGG